MLIRLASSLEFDSIVDGEGVRTVIWTQGCNHNCFGCHNPHTHSFSGGVLLDVNDVIDEISRLKNQDGITFSGGDPMNQALPCLEIAKYCKKNNLNVWCYTGYTFEELLAKNDSTILEFLKYIDVLVDGRFVLKEKSLDLKFKGSRNQRIINVKASLKKGRVVLVKKYIEKKSKSKKTTVYV